VRWPIAILVALVAACGQAQVQTFPVTGEALAGPVCPVETSPPDPACAPRPVGGATIDAMAPGGDVVASTVTDEDGRFTLTLPAGTFTLIGRPYEGLMGSPLPLEVTVESHPLDVGILSYDTGIR